MPIIALAVSIIIMDATVVNVVLPVLIRDISLTASDAEWVNSVYALVFAALLITVGRIGDIFGRRRLLIVGIVVFGIASVLAAMSDSGATLIAARLLQGAGGAMILPATLSTVNALFTGRERGIAFAIWGSTIGGMAAVGPLVGGWLTTDFSWRWAFLINIPIAVIVLIGTLRWVPETKDPHAERGADIAGVVLSILGLGALVFGLIEGQRYGWLTTTEQLTAGSFRWTWPISPVPAAFALGAAMLFTFVLVERSRAHARKPALLDLTLLDIRSFRYGSIAALVVALGEFGMLFALPLFLQGALGYTALDTGLLILSLAVGTFLISGGSAQLTRRLGGRGVVRAGLLLEAVAITGLGLSISLTANGWVLAAWLFLYGIGVGMATAQLTSVILADVPVSQSGQASGLQSTFRQLGSALGIAVLGTLLVSTLAAQAAENLNTVPGLDTDARTKIVSIVKDSAGAAIPEVGSLPQGSPAAQAAAEAAMVTAARITTLSAAGIILLGLLATFALPAMRREDEDDAVVAPLAAQP
ncbi:MFS transporter [Arthrobacter sp. PsM3]|nr:MFS transporter [Arthrobacter sp. PsM3]MDN4642820.1 MFS transporter [Arthrobacter sp. PsM3]